MPDIITSGLQYDMQAVQEAVFFLRQHFAGTKDIQTAQIIIKLMHVRDHLQYMESEIYPEDIPEIDVSQERIKGWERQDMQDKDVIVIDRDNMQVDRSTPLGQAFDRIQQEAGAQEDPAMGSLMNQVLAYTEASLVIDETVEDAAKKEELLGKLRSKISGNAAVS